MTKKYELTIILDGKASSAKKKSVIESIEKTVKLLTGKVVKTEDWGVKQMFHKIGKSQEGLYVHFELELPVKAVRQLSQKLQMDEQILRNLLVVSK